MKYLVRTSPNIVLAWRVSFWPARLSSSANLQDEYRGTYSIKSCTKDVEEPLQNHPSESYTVSHILNPIHLNSMKNWKECGHSHGYKHGCSIWSPCWSPETFKNRYRSACQSNRADLNVSVSSLHSRRSAYHGPVNLLQVRIAIEPVEDTRHETSSDHKDNSNIVKLVPKLRCQMRVI